MTKTETGIILAAGRGSRMKSLTDDKPKCMQEIKGKTVIQRTIDVFENNNINQIVVVTGYKANVLREHLRAKDSTNLIFLHNSIWDSTNSICSMLLALKFLKNSVVIDSDIYVNDEKAILTEFEESGYTARRVDKPDEWQLRAGKDGLIKSVSLSGTFEDGLPIIDVSYWNEEDSNIIAKHLLEAVKHAENYQKYWDEIPLLDFRDELKLRRYDVDYNSLIEFDTEEDLKKVRASV